MRYPVTAVTRVTCCLLFFFYGTLPTLPVFMEFVFLLVDERENRRQHQHMLLREACINKDVQVVKKFLDEFGSDAELLVNMAPNGANTLLFM